MPAARGVKRTASKTPSAGAMSTKIKKKHGVLLEVPARNKLRGRLYACGQGDVGQLGLGEDVVETTRFKFISALGENIVDVCAGGMHTVALDSDGKVWTFGCNDEGALGRTGDEQKVGAVELPDRAVAISAGDSHTAALLQNGDVYLWGSFRDSHGSMGLVCAGREGKSIASPTQLVLPEQVAAIASGSDHLIALTLTGAVYSVGCGEQGQLGRLAQRSASRHARQGLSALLQPAQVTVKVALRSVWAGSHATLALDANSNKILAWGLNNYNQLGITGAKKKTALYAPLEADAFSSVDDVESWTQVACGQHHSLALDNNGKCYAVGRHDYGRLGLGEGSGDSEALTLLPKLADKKCVSIAASTSSSFAVTDTGEVYAWGMGSEGQLGTGDETDRAAPHPVTVGTAAPHKPVKISAGGQHTVLLVVNLSEPVEEPPAEAASTSEPQQKVEAKPAKARGGKTRKPSTSETEVTSSNSAESMQVDETIPEKKLNGEEEPTPMETDETDKPQEPTEKKEQEEKIETDTQEKTDTKPEDSKAETKPDDAKTEPKPDDSKTETKPDDSKTEMKPDELKTETKPVESKTEIIPTESVAEQPKPDGIAQETPAAEKKEETEPKIAESDPKVEPKESEPKALEPAQSELKVAPSEPKPTEAQVQDVEMADKTVNGEDQTQPDVVEKKLLSEDTKTAVSEAL